MMARIIKIDDACLIDANWRAWRKWRRKTKQTKIECNDNEIQSFSPEWIDRLPQSQRTCMSPLAKYKQI